MIPPFVNNQSTSRSSWVIAVSIVVATVAVAGAIVISRRCLNQTAHNNEMTTEDYSSWPVYSDSDDGFSLRVPPGMTVRTYKDTFADTSDHGLELRGSDYMAVLSVDNTIQVGGVPSLIAVREEKTLGEVAALKEIIFRYQILPDGTWFLRYTFTAGGHQYRFGSVATSSDSVNPIPQSRSEEMEAILRSFRAR